MGEDEFTRPRLNKKSIINSILVPMELGALTSAMLAHLEKEKRKFTVVKRDRLSIKEKLARLKTFLLEGQELTLEDLREKNLPRDFSARSDLVLTFISLLELGRLQRVELFQNAPCATIHVKVKKSLLDLDLDQASGFMDEESESLEREVKETKEAKEAKEDFASSVSAV